MTALSSTCCTSLSVDFTKTHELLYLYTYANLKKKHKKTGEYLELSEDQTSERHQELLAEFERRKKVKYISDVTTSCSYRIIYVTKF